MDTLKIAFVKKFDGMILEHLVLLNREIKKCFE